MTGPDGNLWVSIGNGASGAGDPYDGSDSVTELSPALQRLALLRARPRGRPTTPTTSTSARLSRSWSAVTRFIVGKRGVGYLLDAAQPGGIGGQLAPSSPSAGPSARAAISGSMVYEPCQDGGMAAVQVSAAEQDDHGAVARPGRRQRLAGPRRRRGLGHQLTPTTAAARCTSLTRPPGRSGSRSRSARACRTSRRCRSAAAPPTSARSPASPRQRRLTTPGAPAAQKNRCARDGNGPLVRSDADFEL